MPCGWTSWIWAAALTNTRKKDVSVQLHSNGQEVEGFSEQLRFSRSAHR